jgi:hypothetical protein
MLTVNQLQFVLAIFSMLLPEMSFGVEHATYDGVKLCTNVCTVGIAGAGFVLPTSSSKLSASVAASSLERIV